MKKIIITVIALGLFGFANAEKGDSKSETKTENVQQTELVGKVIDSDTGEALVGVEVKLEGTDVKSYTDFDGNFKFNSVKPGEYNVVASYVSYNKSFIEKFDVGNKNNQVNIKLHSSN